MQRLKVNQDIRPMSEFRSGVASFLFWFPRSCVVTHTEQANIHAAEYGAFPLSSVVTFIDMRSHAERGNEGEIILLKARLFIKMMRMV